MQQFIIFFLPIYFMVYFGIAFVVKSVMVAKRIGKNPLVLPKDDTAYGLIGRYFKLTLMAMFIYVTLFSLNAQWFSTINVIDNQIIKYVGIVLLTIALIWTIIAQNHMKDSWRIGIDNDTKTPLITDGLFGISRNPIFLGMVLSLIGLFLVTPNVFTSLFLVLGYVLIQIQIRLEEEFLLTQHGTSYEAYQQKVRRLI